MSQNEPRDGSRPGGWVPYIGHVARLGDLDLIEQRTARYEHVGSKDALTVVRRWADGTEPVAPGDERPAPDLNVAAYLMARLVREVDHLGWTEIAAHTVEQMRSLLAGLPEWCTRCEHWSNDGCPHGLSSFVAWFPPAPGSGGQTGTPGADGGAADGSEQST